MMVVMMAAGGDWQRHTLFVWGEGEKGERRWTEPRKRKACDCVCDWKKVALVSISRLVAYYIIQGALIRVVCGEIEIIEGP